MDARARTRALGMLGLPLLILLGGCGNYTITFEVADVINAWGADLTAEMLDVDIVCITKKDAEHHPEIVNGTMRADEWFKARDEDSPRIGDIEAKRIYALRHGAAGEKRDTLAGLPLLGANDRKDGLRTTAVRVHHPQCLSGDSALVIYGRFSSQEGVATAAPVVIKPLPLWKRELIVKVGKKSMNVANWP